MATEGVGLLWLAFAFALAAVLLMIRGIWERTETGFSFGLFLWYVLTVFGSNHWLRRLDPEYARTRGHPAVRRARALLIGLALVGVVVSLFAPGVGRG